MVKRTPWEKCDTRTWVNTETGTEVILFNQYESNINFDYTIDPWILMKKNTAENSILTSFEKDREESALQNVKLWLQKHQKL